MSSRSLLLPGVLLLTSACSSTSGGSPGDFEGADAEAEAAAVPGDGADSGEPSSDASTGADSGPASNPPEAGTAEDHDVGSVLVACDQPALGVCQTATVPTDMEPSWRAQCTSQGGTADACPAAGLVGCCVGDTSHYCYYSVDFSVSDAQKNCSFMNGTWSTTM